MDEKLERVPFTRDEEQTIISMARWMRFMAVVGIIGAVMILFFLVLGLGLFAAVQQLGEVSPQWEDLGRILEQAGWLLYVMLGVFLLIAIAALWQNFALYRAGDFFNLVAETDIADVDYLADGLDKLRIFFKIQVLIVVVTVVAGFAAAFAVAAVVRHAA